MFVHRPRVDRRVFDLFWGGIQACGITFGTLAQAARIPQASQLELRIVWPSRYQGMERIQKELEPVTNLPSLNVGTWDGRSSLVACARCTFVTFVDATIKALKKGLKSWSLLPT